MAYRIVSPQYSFVNFNNQHIENQWLDDANPYHNLNFCLLVVEHDDIAFQLIIEGDNATQGNNIWNADFANLEFALHTGTPATSINNSDFTNAALRVSFAAIGVEKYKLNATQTLFYFPQLPANLEMYLQHGQCFQLALRVTIASTVVRAISNCLRLESNSSYPYTSLLYYRGNEDEAGFSYCIEDDIINKIRLPLYTTKALYTEDQNVYRQSDGTLTIIKAEIGKAYEVVTDYMPEWIHDCIQALLVHDTKTIISSKYAGVFQKSGSYELDHPKFMDYPLIPAKFKIDASPVLIKNNITGDCVSQDLLNGPSAYGLVFEACSVVELSLADLGITAICGPLTITFSNVYTPPLSTYFAAGTTLVFHFKPFQPIPANSPFILCHVKYECPNGEVVELDIQAEWDGSTGTSCF